MARIGRVERAGQPAIEYEVAGDGVPLVLLHGGAADRRQWSDAGYVDRLVGHYRLIAIDQRGAGASGAPTSDEDHAMERYVDDVLAVLEAEGVEAFACWGLSMGGQVALALAAAAPDRVRALVVAGADLQGWADEPEGYLGFADQIAAEGMAAVIGAFDAPERPMPAWMRSAMAATDAGAFAAAMRARARWPGVRDDADALAMPVLFVGGEHEVPQDAIEAMAALLANGRAARIEGADHIGAFLATDRVLAVVEPFLREAVGAAGEPSRPG